MSGLDKIVEEIRYQAEAEAKEILRKADEYCDAYMDEVHKKVDIEVEEFNKKAESERALYDEKTRSGAEFLERNSILKTKQQCINDCLEQAKNKICDLPDSAYFELMEQILKANVQQGDGIICFGKKDLDRLPKDFENKINEIAKNNGGSLTVSKQDANIGNGFILVYGEIEENCTLKALFDTNIDRLKDIANKELFG